MLGLHYFAPDDYYYSDEEMYQIYEVFDTLEILQVKTDGEISFIIR